MWACRALVASSRPNCLRSPRPSPTGCAKRCVGMAVDARVLDRELSGLDALEAHGVTKRPWWVTAWAALWPKLAAIGLVLVIWQIVFWSHWRDPWVLPPPGRVLSELFHQLGKPRFHRALGITLQRAVAGYSLAIAIGAALGLAVARVRL